MLHFRSFFCPNTSTTWRFAAAPSRPVTPSIRPGAGWPAVINRYRNSTRLATIGRAMTLSSRPISRTQSTKALQDVGQSPGDGPSLGPGEFRVSGRPA